MGKLLTGTLWSKRCDFDTTSVALAHAYWSDVAVGHVPQHRRMVAGD